MSPVTVTEHEAFRNGLENTDGEDLALDPGDFNPPARRKESEINRVLEILDSLPTGEEPA